MDFTLSRAEISMLADIFHPRILSYKKNENFTGSPNTMYIITKGLVYLCVEDELYERSILRFMRPGELFTSNSVIDVYNGFCYMSAKTDTETAAISMNDLTLYLSQHRPWARRIHEALSEGRALSVGYTLHRKSIRSRLLTFLRDEAAIQQSDTIHVPIPFSDLADYLGAERTAMMKELGRMKKEGLISGKNRDLSLQV